MSLNFKEIIVENILNTLDISKVDKAILKTFHSYRDEKGFYGRDPIPYNLSDSEKIVKVAKEFSFDDYDRLVRLYKFYNKYSDILFGDAVNLSDIESPIDFWGDEELIEPIIFLYFYEKYKGKTVKGKYYDWDLDSILSLEESFLEESYTMVLSIGDGEVIPFIHMYIGLFPIKNTGLGYDVISQDDEFSEFNAIEKGARGPKAFDEIIQTGYLKVEVPNDIKKESIDKYIESILKEIKDKVLNYVDSLIKKYIE